jgi:stearoyl-CoA desaturase (delta-9 desaturase)
MNTKVLVAWIDTSRGPTAGAAQADRVDWARIVPFVLLHLACLGIVWVGVSWAAVLVMGLMYVVRMFAITAFYHRYFSHRAFKTSRLGQFLFGVLGASAVQRGPLWWAAHHRHHHAHSDQVHDVHSPARHGFLFSHVGWFLTRRNFATNTSRIRDLVRYPELKLLDRFDLLVPVCAALAIYLLGVLLERTLPELGTNGWQMLVWGFFVSTVLCYHLTYTINSLCHGWGHQRYDTGDDSRNNPLLALFTLGEGWHNNHHHYPQAARQGFYWWEIDITYYVLRLLALLGIVWELKPVPHSVRETMERRRR